ncbi:DNA gyrase subunit A [compost metagenome]
MNKNYAQQYYNVDVNEIPVGLLNLVTGYIAYSKEIIVDRAIVNIDGFKPSQRRIIYSMGVLDKIYDFAKNSTVCGNTAKLHPHGEASVYDTLVRMIAATRTLSIPFLEGEGTFGYVYDNEKPAAMRYTSSKLLPIAKEFLKDLSGVEFMESYDNKYMEPKVLATPYPNVICNPTRGIGVGLASNIPGYNYHEIIKATIELIEKGYISNILKPDFPTGKYIVNNEKEFKKIMETGRGRIKLRGSWYIEGKSIVITSLPYYTDVNAIIEEGMKIEGVVKISDESDRLDTLSLNVQCVNKKVLDDVLTQLLKNTKLQMTVKTNIVVIIDDKPVMLGVEELLRRWCKHRNETITKALKKELSILDIDIPRQEVIVDFLQNRERVNEFIDAVLKKSAMDGRDLLVGWYPDATSDTIDWILERPIKQLEKVGKRIAMLDKLKFRRAEVLNGLANVDAVIIKELHELDTKYSYPRQSIITDEDYIFEKSNVIIKAAPEPTKLVVEGKFVKKLRDNYVNEDVVGITCMSNDIVSFIDDKGRLLRLNLENIPFIRSTERGLYLPVQLELEDDFELITYEVIRDKKVGYVYKDGYVSVVDYGEWVNLQRCTRMTENGVSRYAPSMIAEFDFSKECLLLVSAKGKIGFASVNFKQKARTARTKLVDVADNDEIVAVIPCSYSDILRLVSSPERYRNKVIKVAKDDIFHVDVYKELYARVNK